MSCNHSETHPASKTISKHIRYSDFILWVDQMPGIDQNSFSLNRVSDHVFKHKLFLGYHIDSSSHTTNCPQNPDTCTKLEKHTKRPNPIRAVVDIVFQHFARLCTFIIHDFASLHKSSYKSDSMHRSQIIIQSNSRCRSISPSRIAGSRVACMVYGSHPGAAGTTVGPGHHDVVRREQTVPNITQSRARRAQKKKRTEDKCRAYRLGHNIAASHRGQRRNWWLQAAERLACHCCRERKACQHHWGMDELCCFQSTS